MWGRRAEAAKKALLEADSLGENTRKLNVDLSVDLLDKAKIEVRQRNRIADFEAKIKRLEAKGKELRSGGQKGFEIEESLRNLRQQVGVIQSSIEIGGQLLRLDTAAAPVQSGRLALSVPTQSLAQ